MRKSVCLSIAGLIVGAWLSGCGGDEPQTATDQRTQDPKQEAALPHAVVTPPARLTPEQADDIFPLLVLADADVTEGKAPLTVRFKTDATGGLPPYKIIWNFGDGSPEANERHVTHTFATPGAYRVDLVVRDAQNDVDTDYVIIEVQ